MQSSFVARLRRQPQLSPTQVPHRAFRRTVLPMESSGRWKLEAAIRGVLHAYDASNLANELYNSNQAGGRDAFADSKYITQMIANGKVFIGTLTGVMVFGLLR